MSFWWWHVMSLSWHDMSCWPSFSGVNVMSLGRTDDCHRIIWVTFRCFYDSKRIEHRLPALKTNLWLCYVGKPWHYPFARILQLFTLILVVEFRFRCMKELRMMAHGLKQPSNCFDHKYGQGFNEMCIIYVQLPAQVTGNVVQTPLISDQNLTKT